MSSTFNISEASAQDSNIFVQEVLSPSQQIKFSFANGVTRACIFIAPTSGQIPRNQPRMLKTEIDTKFGPNAPVTVKFTRAGKLLIETTDVNCAQIAADITQILNVPVSTYLQQEAITTRFVIHNIDTSIRLEDLGREIQSENDVKIKEVRRFTKKDTTGVHMTETVLVTIFGTNLPREIKLFYMLERIKPFYDRPRQCLNCWKFDHATMKCKNETVCRKCGNNHAASACSSSDVFCINCQASHWASDFQCPSRSQEMNLLKYKTDNHLPITEARRLYARSPKSKNYSEAVKTSSELAPHPQYVTKVELEQTMELFFQKTQQMLAQVVQQQTTLFLQTIESLVSSLTSGNANTTQRKGAQTEKGKLSPPPLKRSNKKSKLDDSTPTNIPLTPTFCNRIDDALLPVTGALDNSLKDNMEET